MKLVAASLLLRPAAGRWFSAIAGSSFAVELSRFVVAKVDREDQSESPLLPDVASLTWRDQMADGHRYRGTCANRLPRYLREPMSAYRRLGGVPSSQPSSSHTTERSLSREVYPLDISKFILFSDSGRLKGSRGTLGHELKRSA